MQTIIKSIKKLEYCKAAELAAATIVRGKGIAGTSGINFTEICIEPFASMQVTSEIDNNQEVFETVITARIRTTLPDRSVNLAFRVTSVSGESFVIGDRTTPFPVIKQTDNYPENVSDSQLTDIEISWNSTDRPFKILS